MSGPSPGAAGGRIWNTITGSLAGLGSLRTAVLVPPRPIREPTEAASLRAGAAHVLTRTWLLPVGSLVVFCVVFSTAYNVRVPLYEAPDEAAHIAYVDSLQRDASIPRVSDATSVAVGPPLYHGVGAAALKLLGLTPPGPHPFIDNDFPYHGPALSIHLLRGISTLFGAATVVLVYMIALLLFPDRKLLAWAVGANTALLPQLLFVGGAVMNDTALAFFSAAAMYSIIRVVKSGDGLWVVTTALTLGLGFVTEASALIVAVVCAMALLLSPLSWRNRGLALALFVAAPALLAGWYYLRNIIEYGDYYPDHLLLGLGPGLPLNDEAYRGAFQQTLFDSYWYTGGGMTIRVAGAMYQFLNVIAGMAFGGVLVFLFRHHLSSLQKRGLPLLGALLLVNVIQVIWYSATISFQPQGRFLFVAQPAIAIILALGISTLFQRDPQRDSPAALLLPVILLGLNLGIFTMTLPANY